MSDVGSQTRTHGDSPLRLVVVLGTRAQTIKMAPLLAEMERAGLPYQLLMTGQHRETICDLLNEFGVQTEKQWLYKGQEIKGIGQAVKWMLSTFWQLWRLRRQWAPRPSHLTIVLAHGDTFSTVLAAAAGRLAGAQVAHVEAGLRSFNWRQPFPEELNRILVTRLAQIAYCPGEWACGNLNPRKLQIVDTQGNTILDALRTALAKTSAVRRDSEQPHAVASIHRFENLYSRQRFGIVLDTLQKLSQHLRVIVVLHPVTRKRLIELGELEKLERNPRIELMPRMTYLPFIRLIGQARMVITDGGSNQEELSYLGVPTLLMRMATERQEGLGENVVLSRFDETVVDAFIAEVLDAKAEVHLRQLPDFQPVSIIVEDLRERLK